MSINPVLRVHSPYGAPMGGPALGHGVSHTTAFELRRIRINNGGYDDGGAYWGLGIPLYWYCAYETDDMIETGRCLYCNQSVHGAINGDCREFSSGQHKFETHSEEKRTRLLQRAKDMRYYASKGMKPRAYLKEALRIEAEAAAL